MVKIPVFRFFVSPTKAVLLFDKNQKLPLQLIDPIVLLRSAMSFDNDDELVKFNKVI
jgi:hypothetical protein